jgi:hypothetical protein
MSDAAPAVAGVAALAIDCADSPGLANWWSRLLGGSVEVDPERNATLRTLQGLAIDFLRVPDHKTVKNRLHLDLCTSSLAAATQQALALGATRAGDVYDGGRWQVLRDPEGNEFCLLRPNSDPREEGPRLCDLVVVHTGGFARETVEAVRAVNQQEPHGSCSDSWTTG